MMMWRLAFFVLCLPGLASAETFTWGCNPEADMKEYRGERSDNGGATWGVLFKKDHVPGCTELSYQSTAYVKPGDKLGRLFACDKTGQCSAPSTPPVSYKIATPIIGNPGGQTETPLPPSPFAGAVTPPPPVATGILRTVGAGIFRAMNFAVRGHADGRLLGQGNPSMPTEIVLSVAG